MISKSYVSSRRILTFPAIRPCEAVSPATLFDSLTLLTSNICNHDSKSFITNHRNIHQSIRIIKILSIFFEEIRENRSILSNSIVLSFSELHFVFQQLLFLLEDCTRDDSRLWMLMKAEFVANQIRVLTRAIPVALDVLPLGLIEISLETRESVQLATKQARKSRFEVDPIDRLASDDVISILSQFEDGVVPESVDLIRVLNHLGIQSWSQCNREIKFLESEMGFEYLSEEKRDLGLMSSLIGLMIYCRGVIFDEIDNLPTQQCSESCRNLMIRDLNTDDFRCPISLEVMTDPVTIETGHTYDRLSIQRWFKDGNHTCPKTGETLTSTDLVPNLALQRLISQYCCENGISVAEKGRKRRNIIRTAVAGSLAAEKAMRMLADFLVGRLQIGTGEEREKATFEVRILTKATIFNRSCLAESGAIPHLLDQLLSKNSLAQENAIAGLLNLSKHSKSKNIIVENGGVELVLGVLKEGLKMEARQHAAGTLFYLASVEEYRVLIGEIPGAIPTLMDLIRVGSDRGKKNALVAIFGLLMHPDNHWRVLSCGLVPLLANLLTSFEREDLIVDSLAVLATIAEKRDGTYAILRGGILPIIVEILNSTTSMPGKEYCVSLLLALCINGGGDAVPVLIKNTSLMTPLYALLTEGTSRASKKASSLIRLLHEFHERSSSSLTTLAFPRDRFIHAW